MPTESRNGFAARHRWTIGVSTAFATVLVLVLIYRVSAPKTGQTTTASGKRIPDSDVLQVGALPVT